MFYRQLAQIHHASSYILYHSASSVNNTEPLANPHRGGIAR